MSMTVKAYLKRGENANAEIRRFVIDESVTSNYEYLSKKVAQVFPSLGSPENFSLSWKDAEDDLITFSSDDELMVALGQLNEDIFRIYVRMRKNGGRREGHCQNSTAGQATPTDGQQTPNAGPAEEEVWHPGVICDGCESRIRGPRFKCITCPDYDLCKRCETLGLHPEHSFVKFRKPQVGRTHNGGFFNRPGMFRQFGHPGWRRWWMWHQQQQQNQNQGQQQQSQGANASTGCSAGPGPQGECGFPMGGPGPCPPGPNMPGQQEFLRDIGQSVAQMLDPLGIDVDIDIDHNGERTHFAGEGRTCGGGRGKHGRRHGGKGGRRGCRNTWAGGEGATTSMETEGQEQGQQPGASAPPAAPAPTKEGATQNQQPEATKDNAGEGMETNGGSVNSPTGGAATGSDDADWTMLEDGNGAKPSSPPSQQSTSADAPAFVYQAALNQMQAMGFDNEGGWLTSLLEAKGGDIGRVLDAIKVGTKPTFNVQFK